MSVTLRQVSQDSSAQISVGSIVPNQRQPRHSFDEDALQELAASIKAHGILSPLLVRRMETGTFELIAGERRLRASKLAGLDSVPVIILGAGSQSSLEIAIVENVQREDMNCFECAVAYRRLMDEFGLTQEQVAERVGKSRATIANTVRLLRLPPKVLEGLASSRISEGHARALLALNDEIRQLSVYEEVLRKNLSVREIERMKGRSDQPITQPSKGKGKDPDLMAVEQRLSERFGAPVQVGGGEISISYFSEDDLVRILDHLQIDE